MARPKANSTAKVAAVDENAAATEETVVNNVNEATDEKSTVGNKSVKDEVAETKVEDEVTEKTEPTQAQKPLTKDDEIEVISMIPNVSYKDKSTLDIYEWTEAGQVEVMTYGTLQNMWREFKGYFKNMWLKPLDDRVIKKFGLKGTYSKYDFLMEPSNYTKNNIDVICDSIKSTPSSLKLSLCNRVKTMVASGEVNDISVIKAIENSLNIDLIELVG